MTPTSFSATASRPPRRSLKTASRLRMRRRCALSCSRASLSRAGTRALASAWRSATPSSQRSAVSCGTTRTLPRLASGSRCLVGSRRPRQPPCRQASSLTRARPSLFSRRRNAPATIRLCRWTRAFRRYQTAQVSPPRLPLRQQWPRRASSRLNARHGRGCSSSTTLSFARRWWRLHLSGSGVNTKLPQTALRLWQSSRRPALSTRRGPYHHTTSCSWTSACRIWTATRPRASLGKS
mmetsp:Transcript_1658/g.4223  ORF Transcript_1658/g.4223 Transcript_1658/m.4223 type:complete len:237 (+) Transcript_1658:1308-2018(+)